MFFSSFVLPAFRATIKHFLFIISYYIAKIVLYILFCNIKHSKKMICIGYLAVNGLECYLLLPNAANTNILTINYRYDYL